MNETLLTLTEELTLKKLLDRVTLYYYRLYHHRNSILLSEDTAGLMGYPDS